MKHYEQRIEQDLTAIKGHIDGMVERVQTGLKNAVHALLTGNRDLAYRTILDDHPINRDLRKINRLCYAFVAKHLPSAVNLRRISAILRVVTELERIGDYAVTICREAVVLQQPPQGSLARDIELIAEESRSMLRQAVMAFQEDNADLAKGTMVLADQIERTFDRVFADLVEEGDTGGRSTKQMFALFVVASTLERVSDQAKNICEETVFIVTGEEKPLKVYRILFVDRNDATVTKMAVAIAGKAFPNSGVYSSAGKDPAAALDDKMVAYMESKGFDLQGVRPQPLELSHEELASLHLIVSLDGPVTDYVPEVPFHTVALEWKLPTPGADADEQAWEDVYQQLILYIRGLMEALRGEEAN